MNQRTIDSTTEWLLGVLGPLGDVEARRMFGGQGVYRADAMFGIVHEGRVFFKVDDETRPAYEAEGAEPFRPRPSQTLKTFYEVPAEVLEDGGRLREWAGRAADAAAVAKK